MLQDRSIAKIERLITEAKRLGLDDNGVFSEFTVEDIAKEYNGLGPDWFPSWLHHFLSSDNRYLEPAAVIHDMEFVRGGDHRAFREANARLRKNGELCINDKWPRLCWTRLFYLARLILFVKLCNSYGEIGWNHTC